MSSGTSDAASGAAAPSSSPWTTTCEAARDLHRSMAASDDEDVLPVQRSSQTMTDLRSPPSAMLWPEVGTASQLAQPGGFRRAFIAPTLCAESGRAEYADTSLATHLMKSSSETDLTSVVSQRFPDGTLVRYRSRQYRLGKRPEIVRDPSHLLPPSPLPDERARRSVCFCGCRPTSAPWWSALTFLIGGILFTEGSFAWMMPAVGGRGAPDDQILWTVTYPFFIGSLMFTVGCYATLLVVVNANLQEEVRELVDVLRNSALFEGSADLEGEPLPLGRNFSSGRGINSLGAQLPPSTNGLPPRLTQPPPQAQGAAYAPPDPRASDLATLSYSDPRMSDGTGTESVYATSGAAGFSSSALSSATATPYSSFSANAANPPLESPSAPAAPVSPFLLSPHGSYHRFDLLPRTTSRPELPRSNSHLLGAAGERLGLHQHPGELPATLEEQPPKPSAADALAANRHAMRWWGWQPNSLLYWAAFLQLTSAILFNIACGAGLPGLMIAAGPGTYTTEHWEEFGWVYVPCTLGSIGFVFASYVYLAEVTHSFRLFTLPDEPTIGFVIAWLNLGGSFLFLTASLCYFARAPPYIGYEGGGHWGWEYQTSEWGVRFGYGVGSFLFVVASLCAFKELEMNADS